jgi:hypothetical protein
VSFSATTLCIASQGVFIFVVFYFVMTQSGNFCVYPHMYLLLNNVWKENRFNVY